MGDTPSDSSESSPPIGDDDLHLRVSRRALRRVGLVALILAVAVAGLGAGLLIADDDSSGETVGGAARKRKATTSTTLVSTTVPPTAVPGADASGSSGATESVATGDAADPGAAAAPAAEAQPEPEPEPPTLSITLTPIPLGCAGIGPTLRVSWSTDTGAVVQLNIDNQGYGPMQPSGAVVVDVDCGRDVVVQGIPGGDTGVGPLVVESIVIVG